MMTILRRAVLVCLLLPVVVFAQSADQEVVSVVDSPDPVAPGATLSYTVTIRNNGPDPATNGGLNINLPLAVTHTTDSVPAGWTCFWAGAAGTCNTPSFAAGTTEVLTINVMVGAYLANFPDQDILANFFPSGVTPDPNAGNNSKSATTTVDAPQIDLLVTASDSPDPVFPDGNVTYTGTITNDGPDTATTVNFNVVPNPSLTFQSATLPAGWNCTLPNVGWFNATFTCSRPSFAPGTDNFTVVFAAQDEYFGINDTTFHTNFNVNGVGDDTNDPNNSVTVSTQYSTPDADQSIAATDAPDPVANGGMVTFDITVENSGPDDGVNSVATFSPHPSLTFQSLTAPAGWSCTTPPIGSAGVTQCSLNPLPNGGVAVFQLVTQVVAAGAGGVLQSSFSISSNAQDPNLVNNSAQVFTTWIGATSDLAISKSTLESAVAQGGTITYTISTSNNGPDAATGLTVTDVLHAALLFQSLTAPAGWSCTTPAVGANGTITCTAATLANGATAEFTLVTTVAPNATGSIPNSATVSGANDDPNAGNNGGASSGVTVAGNADLSVTKTTGVTSASPGGSISYTISVMNAGPDPAASVEMTDVLPASLMFQSIATPAGWSCTTPAVGANGTVTCTAATLASGATATFTLVASVASGATGSIVNSASASHSGPDGNAGNSSGSTGAVAVTAPEADIEITKTTTATTATPGGTLSYTITVTNAGPSDATNVVVTDDLPAGLAFVSATPSQGTCNASDPVTCNLGTIINGGSATITLTAQVTATSGTIANTASVTSTEGDTDSSTTAPIPVASAEVAAIPTASEWGLMLLAAMLAIAAAMKMRT